MGRCHLALTHMCHVDTTGRRCRSLAALTSLSPSLGIINTHVKYMSPQNATLHQLIDPSETLTTRSHSMFGVVENLKPLNLMPRQNDDPFALPLHDDRIHLLLCASGSVATIKIPNIVQALAKHPRLSIRLILTESAKNFLQGQSAEQPSLAKVEALPNVDGIYFDEDEWREPWVRGNKILHIELRRWADLLVVAPLSADALAKITQGWSDNLLLSVIRAWDTTGELDPMRDLSGLNWPREEGGVGIRRSKTIVVAPSMNTAMWNQPITGKHIKVLDEEWGVKNGGWFEVLHPMEKELACGDVGSGAMKDWREIVQVIEARLGLVP